MAQIEEESKINKEEELKELRGLAERGELTAEHTNMYWLDLLQELEDSGDITDKEQAILNDIRAIIEAQRNSPEGQSLLLQVEKANILWEKFTKKYGKMLQEYKLYVFFIEKELQKDFDTYNLWATAETTEAYIKAYKIEAAPDQIGEEEKAEIKRFVIKYVSEERKSKSPPGIDPTKELLELDGFIRMLQGTGTNKLSQISSRRMIPQIDPITGTATVSYNNFTARFDNFNSLPGLLPLNAIMLLDVCVLYLSRLNEYGKGNNLETAISIPLEEYMGRCDIPITKASKDKTRREAKDALETLYSLSIEFDEEKTVNGKKVTEHYHTRILQDRSEIKNGIIYARFGQRFVEYLNMCGLMEYSTALLKIDRRTPTVYHIGRKLCYQSSLDNNRAKGNANKLSVAKLLDCCTDIPSYKEVSETDRHYDRRIIKPFEEALDALKNKYNIIGNWEYCNKGEAPLTDDQLNNLSYDTFIKLLIKYDIKNAPDPKDRLAAKAETIKKRNTKKRAAINKACKKKTESTEPQSEG